MSNEYLKQVIQNVTGNPATKDQLAAVKDRTLNEAILNSNTAASQAINAEEQGAPKSIVNAFNKTAEKHYVAAEKREAHLKDEFNLGKFSPIETLAVVSLQKPELQQQLAGGAAQSAGLAGNFQSKGTGLEV